MKKYFIVLFYMSLLVLLFLAGCKKYGYDYADGYEYGEENGNASGAITDSLGPDFSKLDRAWSFPGLMAATEERKTNVTIEIDFTAKIVRTEDIKTYQTPQSWFSTGYYAPAGEPVKIEVPQNQHSLIAVIGGWTDNLTGITGLRRDPVVSYQQLLKPGVNYLRNLYGGTLYIRVNGQVENMGVVPVTISGAAASPDFILGQSTDAEWKASIESSSVPWFQLRGKKIIFELPKLLYDNHPIAHPTALMEEWDRIIDRDVYGFKGLKEETTDSLDKAPGLPIRVIMDIQPRRGNIVYAHSGYPIVLQLDEFFYGEITDLQKIKTSGAIRTMLEIGNNNNSYVWPWAAITQTSAHLFQLKAANRLGIPYTALDVRMQPAIVSGLQYVKQAKTWSSNFSRDITAYKNAELVRLLPFIQLAEVYGYGILTYIDSLSRHEPRNMPEQERINFFYTNASRYAKKDLIPFFRAWAIYISSGAVDSISADYPYLDQPVYTYDPQTGEMDDIPVPPPSPEIERIGWMPIRFSSQESDNDIKGYAVNLLDGDVNTFWSTRISGSPVPPPPHYVVIDMGRLNEVNGFWLVNTANPAFAFFPTNIKISLSANNEIYEQVWQGTGWNTPGYQQVYFGATYSNMRYIRFEATGSFSSATRLNLSEFGALKPVN